MFAVTNISRIILSQTIKSLNLHECAILDAYEKVSYHIDGGLDAVAYRM